MKRKLVATLLVIGMVVMLLPIGILSVSADAPTEINNKADLLAFATAIAGGNAYAGQTVNINADIDVEGETWPIMAGNTINFSGMIDGHGHTIQGMSASTSTYRTGLFGAFLMPASADDPFVIGVKNLTVKNSSITGAGAVGGLFGQSCDDSNSKHGTVLFENLDLDITVSGSSNSYYGELVGNSRSDKTTVSNCIIRGSVSGLSCVGGLFGWEMDKETAVENTVVSGTVRGTGTNVGGFFGQVRERAGSHTSTVTMTNCVFNGTVVSPNGGASASVGGFVGTAGADNGSAARSTNLTIEKSAFYGTIQVGKAEVTSGKIGSIVGATYGNKDVSRVTLQKIIINGNIDVTGTVNEAACGKVIGLANKGAVYSAEGIAGQLTGTAAAWEWGNYDENIGSKTVANQVTASITNGMTSLIFTEAEDEVDLSGDFITTLAKPLPLGVLDLYRDAIDDLRNGETANKAGFYQDREEGDGSLSVRLIGLVKDSALEYDSVGLEITVIRKVGGELRSANNLTAGVAPATTTVYTSVLDGSTQKAASTLNAAYGYLYTATVSGIQKNAGSLTVAVKTFHVQSGTRVYDDMAIFDYSTVVA